MTLRRLLLLFLLFAAFVLYAAYVVLRPYQGFSEADVFLDIRRGSDALEMASSLEAAGVLASRWSFLLLRALPARPTLKAGEYRFDRPMSPLDVHRKIADGDVFFHSFTVPEGYNLFEIAEGVGRTGLITAQEFLLAARQGGRLADLAPGVPTLEGFLFPDTYRLTRQTTAEELVGQMLRRFRDVWVELGGAGNTLQIVTLASLVEEETPRASERHLVASVFANRLRIGMPLQCDPTVIYALRLAGRYRGELARAELAVSSPYNTYAHPGLPPGPIASPGRASLAAALAPASSDFLYFVADHKGGHVFSASLGRHSEAVARYRRANSRPPKKQPSKKQNARRR